VSALYSPAHGLCKAAIIKSPIRGNVNLLPAHEAADSVRIKIIIKIVNERIDFGFFYLPAKSADRHIAEGDQLIK